MQYAARINKLNSVIINNQSTYYQQKNNNQSIYIIFYYIIVSIYLFCHYFIGCIQPRLP